MTLFGKLLKISYLFTLKKKVAIFDFYHRVSQKKKATIGPPKPQFLGETFEILVVGRISHSRFSAILDFKKVDFKGPKSEVEIFKNSQN